VPAEAESVGATAWLDHEWSSSYMDKEAVGWDWIGINFDNGAALMAFQMRNPQAGSSGREAHTDWRMACNTVSNPAKWNSHPCAAGVLPDRHGISGRVADQGRRADNRHRTAHG